MIFYTQNIFDSYTLVQVKKKHTYLYEMLDLLVKLVYIFDFIVLLYEYPPSLP